MILDGGKAKLEVRHISSLLPHEETIPSHVSDLASQLATDGVQRDPIIVDEESGVVLDGMHRLSALEKLGIANVVCALVRYASDSVAIGSWVKLFEARDDGSAKALLSDLGVSRAIGEQEAKVLLDNRKCAMAAKVDAAWYIPGDARTDLQAGFGIIKNAEKKAQARAWGMRIATAEELTDEMTAGDLAIFVPRLEKEDVLGAGTSGRLFPCKTSMHLVDLRPLGVRAPLSALRNDSAAVMRLLGTMKAEVRPAGSLYEGRMYGERILVLTPS